MAKLYNSAMLEVSFKVTADLRIGEEVRLSGSAPALGLWDPNRAVPLVTTPATYPRWTTKESIFLPDGDGDDAIKYRYAVFSGGCFKRWESHQGGETILRELELLERRGISGVTEDVIDVPPNLITRKIYEKHSQRQTAISVRQKAQLAAASEVPSEKNKHFSAWGLRSKSVVDERKISQDDRVIVVSYILPVQLHKSSTGEWSARWDNESILSMSMDNASRTQGKISWVGTVRYRGAAIPPEDQPGVSAILSKMDCFPIYVTQTMHHQFYDVYCKSHLWLILHMVADVYGPLVQDDIGAKAQQDLWYSYSTVNRMFRDKVIEAFNAGDLVWIHGFHLMLLPSFLRRVIPVAKIGYFFHTPFPSSEIWRTITRRKDLLRGILAADQIGFHLYEYARHFMTTCLRVLGHGNTTSDGGQLAVTVDKREVAITCIHVGVDMPKINAALTDPTFASDSSTWRSKLGNKIVVGGIDRLERLKGIPLKLICIDQFMEENPQWRGKLMFSIIGISAAERGDDYRITVRDVKIAAKSINSKYSNGPGDIVVHFEEKQEREFNLAQRLAYFTACDLLMMTATRDGLSRTPMEFTLARHEARKIAESDATLAAALASDSPSSGSNSNDDKAPLLQKGHNLVVISEFVSAARIMRGAITVNPWRVDDVKKALGQALTLDKTSLDNRFKRNLEFSTKQTTQNWAVQILNDLKAVEKSEEHDQTLKLGFAMGFKVMGMSASFKPVDIVNVSKGYRASHSRLIVLDWGGTLVENDDKTDNLRAFAVAQGQVSHKGPSQEVCSLLEKLCADVRNNVFVVSGKELVSVSEHFGHIRNLGLGAEHGFYYRWPRDEFRMGSRRSGSEGEYLPQGPDSEDSDGFDANVGVRCRWQTLAEVGDQSWKEPARLLMNLFVQRTHGTYVEEKGNALIWQFRDADPEFGFLQSKELEDHLKDMLSTSKEVEVIRGGGVSDGYIEVRPTGVNKGLFLEHLLATLKNLHRSATFVMAIGDDSSDEAMFEQIQRLNEDDMDTFGITVGKKPSAAGAYVDDTSDVLQLLNTLCRATKRDKKHFSAVDLPSKLGAGGPAHSALRENFNALEEKKRFRPFANTTLSTQPSKGPLSQPNTSNALSAANRAMSVDHLPLHQHQEEGEGIQRTLSSARLTMTGYLESINDNADEKDEGIFF